MLKYGNRGRGYRAIHLAATNDGNGNPRRFSLILDRDHVVAAVDEGYEGIIGSLSSAGFGAVPILVTHIPTTASYRRDSLRELPNTVDELAAV